METDKADKNKDRNKTSVKGEQPKGQQHPTKDHTSQGHATDEEGTGSSKEPTLRGSTTDSSRTHKNPHDDLPTGGNVR